MQRRWHKRAARAGIVTAAILGGLVLVVFLLLRTGPGHGVIAWAIEELSGGDVVVSGLYGALPGEVHADSVELRDERGLWLKLENVDLDWRPFALLGDHIDVASASAGRVVIMRKPEPSGDDEPSDLHIDVAQFRIARIEFAEAAFGHAAALTASGALHYASLKDAAADIAARRLDAYGVYRLKGRIRDGAITGTATIAEKGDGIAGGLVGLTTLGPVSLDARAAMAGNDNVVDFTLHAGELQASGHGTVAMGERRAGIEFSGSAPAMHPSPDMAWAALSFSGSLEGSFDRPLVAATLYADQLKMRAFSAGRVEATAHGSSGDAEMTGIAENFRLTGAPPDAFAAAPVRFSARADLSTANRPVSFALEHPLLQVRGRAATRGVVSAAATMQVNAFQPFAAAAGIRFGGSGRFTINVLKAEARTAILVDGRIDAAGDTALARLIGRGATLALRTSLNGSRLASAQGRLKGAAVTANLAGLTENGALAYRWDIAVSDVSRVAPTLTGAIVLQGSLTGTPRDATVTGTGQGVLGTRAFAKERIGIAFSAEGLPDLKGGEFHLDGRFAGAPLAASGRFVRDRTRAFDVTLERANWKSLNAQGTLTAPPNGAARGKFSVRAGNLADLEPLIGTRIEGALAADVTFTDRHGQTLAQVRGTASNLAAGTARVARLDIGGDVADALGKPTLGLTLTAAQWNAAGATGSANATVRGPLDNIAVTLNADAATTGGERVALSATASADTHKRAVVFSALQATWHERTLRLTAPATVDYANGIGIERLRAALGSATIELAGRLTPTLAATVSVSGVTPDLVPPDWLKPGTLEGTFSGTAKLTGTLSAPEGTFELAGSGVRLAGTSEHSMPATVLDAHGTLHADSVALDATLTGGSSLRLAVRGEVPLSSGRAMNLRANGTADLGLTGAFLAAHGQTASGKVTLDTTIGGTFAAPHANGTMRLAGGEFRDYRHGVRLREIEAQASADGNVIRVSRFTARAGDGSISGSGTIDLAHDEIPVDFRFAARDARPIASDRVSATLNGELKLTGLLREHMTVSGEVRIAEGQINIPEKFPPTVAVLNVQRRGVSGPPPPVPSVVTLDVTVSAENRIFVRGRGLDAEMSGRLKIAGTAGDPEVIGALDMRRGTFAIAGTTLEIKSGKVSFDGASLRRSLDPTLDFVAETNSGGVTATLKITGYASAPKIELSSSPQLPQDEIFAHLMFQQSVKQLSPLQLAQIAEAMVSLTGAGSGFNPVAAVRRSLGLDRLAVGSTQTSSGESSTTVEAGKYVSHNIYVGARQDFSGGTHAIVQVDITHNLKAQAQVSTGARPATPAPGTPAVDNGDSVGLSYQFEY